MSKKVGGYRMQKFTKGRRSQNVGGQYRVSNYEITLIVKLSKLNYLKLFYQKIKKVFNDIKTKSKGRNRALAIF